MLGLVPAATRSLIRAHARSGAGWAGRLLRNLPFVVGVLLLVGFVGMALSHPIMMETVWADEPRVYNPITGYDREITHPSGPSSRHLLGTDSLGRDVLSMTLFATRDTLTIALMTALMVGVVSVVVGAVSAFWRGLVDAILSHVADGMLLLPAPIAMIAFGLARPEIFTPFWFGLAYGVLAGFGAAAIVVRSYGLTVMAKPFIDAARSAGGGPWHIIRVHLVPHLLPLAAIQMMLSVVGAIIVSGFVEFMSPGRTDRVGYGGLVYLGLTYRDFIVAGTPWAVLLAGALGISLMCAAFYVLSVGLRQVVDPTIKQTWIGVGRPASIPSVRRAPDTG